MSGLRDAIVYPWRPSQAPDDPRRFTGSGIEVKTLYTSAEASVDPPLSVGSRECAAPAECAGRPRADGLGRMGG